MTKHHDHHAHHASPPVHHPFSLDGLHAAASGPTPGRAMRQPQQIEITLEARETEWELQPGLRVGAWGYQGVVPGR